jgi:pimeloyl-ACP methyl ester carboxylesterase
LPGREQGKQVCSVMRLTVATLALLWLLIANVACCAEAAEYFATEPVFGTKVRIVEAGRNQPLSLVLIHGVGSEGAEIWRELIPELSLRYHVIACDLPGFGKSEQPNTLYSPERFSDFMAWLVKRTVPGPFILVGHSLGGALALHYTATAPVKPDKLIIIDAAGILHRTALTKFFLHLKITSDKPYAPHAVLSWFDRLAGTMVEKLQGLPVNLDLLLHSATLREKILGSDPNKIAGLALIQTDFTLLINQVETPTFLIWGENDDIAPLRTGQLLAGKLPHAQLQLIPDGGHIPMRQQPSAFRQTFWHALQTLPVDIPQLADTQPERVGTCADQEDAHFSGHYRSIELLRCQNARMIEVTTQKLSVTESEVTIERSRINGADVGLHTVRSRIVATTLDITAELPILTDQSSPDLAGVILKTRGKELVSGEGNPSRILFSVSRGLGPERDTPLHGVISVTAQQPL